MTRLALPTVSLISALVLAACGTPYGSERSEMTHTIGPEGAGGLTAATPFTVPAMERAFPGLEVITVVGADMPTFHIYEATNSAPVYVVTPDWTRGYAGAVSTGLPDVTGPDGLRAGVSRLSEAPQPLKENCAAPEMAGDITLICESPNFRLEFSGPGPDPLLARQTYLPPLP